jgi:thioredoxin reductase (NADPH)
VNGFILTGPNLVMMRNDGHNNDRPKGWNLDREPFLRETSVPGIFAAGDVCYGSIKRVASGVRALLLYSSSVNTSSEYKVIQKRES